MLSRELKKIARDMRRRVADAEEGLEHDRRYTELRHFFDYILDELEDTEKILNKIKSKEMDFDTGMYKKIKSLLSSALNDLRSVNEY